MHPQPSRRIPQAITLLLAAVVAVLCAFVPTASATGPVTNPNLQPACGAKVILVLDESGSISSTSGAEAAVRDAAMKFASGLADTGSQLAVIEFGSSAKRVFGYTNVTSGAGGTLATTFNPYFNGSAAGDKYDSPSQLGQWTNWEDALEEVKLLNTQSVAPLVVFVTDGDPTARNTTGGVQTGVSNATALTPAIVQADGVKSQGSHILAVGVGAALGNSDSLNRLIAISGPDVASTVGAVNLSTTDVLRIADFSTLPTALRTLVNELCKSSVTIKKMVDNGQGYVPGGAGWQFNATVSTAAGSYSWITPAPPASTGADSAVTFQWKPTVLTTSTINISETAKLGYQFVSAACKVKSLANPNLQTLSITTNGASFTANLGPTDVVTCDVKNKKMSPAVSITKDVNKSRVLKDTPVVYTIKVTNTGDVPLNSVAVSDPITPDCAKGLDSPLAPLASWTYTCNAVIEHDTTNVATVTAKDPQNTPVTPISDDADVDVIAPAISITKDVDKAMVLGGTPVNWTVVVTNTGDATLTNVTVTDPGALDCGMPIGMLAPGVSRTLTCSTTVNVDTTNVASVTATDPLGNQLLQSDDAYVDVIAPALSITKSVDKPVVLSGTDVTWTVMVRNSGDVDLTNVAVSDPDNTGCNATIDLLPAGQSYGPITCTETITEGTTNTANVSGKDPIDNVLQDGDTAWVQVIAPGLSITKSVDKPVVLSGTEVTWKITVKNTGDTPLDDVTVADPVAPGCARVIESLGAGETAAPITCKTTVTVDTVNTATVTATDRLENTVGPASATARVDVIAPAIDVTKSVDKADVAPGTAVTYTIVVHNTGDVALTNAKVADPTTPACDKTIGELAAGASTSYTCIATINVTTTNVATVTGTDPLGNPLTKSDDAKVTVTPIVVIGVQTTTLAIDKRGPAKAKAGQIISYTIKVTNTGTVTADNVIMRDRIPASMSLAVKTPGVKLVKGQIEVQVGNLAPGASKTITVKFRVDRRAAGFRTNTAIASASNAPTVRDSARTRVIRIVRPVVVPRVTG